MTGRGAQAARSLSPTFGVTEPLSESAWWEGAQAVTSSESAGGVRATGRTDKELADQPTEMHSRQGTAPRRREERHRDTCGSGRRSGHWTWTRSRAAHLLRGRF